MKIIPKPTLIKQQSLSDTYHLNRNEPLLIQYSTETLQQVASLLKESILRMEFVTNVDLKRNELREKGVYLSLVEDMEPLYSLSICDSGVVIKAKNAQGVFYATQTLLQVMYSEMKDISSDVTHVQLPCTLIEDIPQYEWRGLMLDNCRHYFDKNFVKLYIDVLSFYKMNVFHWHLTDDQGWRIQINKYPNLTKMGSNRRLRPDEITNAQFMKENEQRIFKNGKGELCYGGFFSQDDIREIVQYASERFVTIVPEIEMPGHSMAALSSYPEFSCTGGPFEVPYDWGVYQDVYCAGNDATFAFLEEVLSEVIELFPSQFVHIGGDECPKERWHDCPKCQKRMKEEHLKDEHELQSYFVQRIGKFLEQKGKRLTGWDEILEGGLAKGATVQSWRGLDGAIQAIKQGHDAILSPGDPLYLDQSIGSSDLERVYSFAPSAIKDSENGKVLGGEGPIWSEQCPVTERINYQVFPRVLAISEVFWLAKNATKDYEEFLDRSFFHEELIKKRFGIIAGPESKPVNIKATYKLDLKQFYTEIAAIDRCSLKNLVFHYTTDGSDPDISSPKYTGAFTCSSNTKKIRSLAYLGDRAYGIESYINLCCNEATGKPVVLVNPYSKQYPGTGYYGLSDGYRGEQNFYDPAWQGWLKDDIIATVHLGQVTQVSKVAIGMLQATNSWILFPEYVSVDISLDGEKYENIGKYESSIPPQQGGTILEDFEVKLSTPKPALMVRVHAKNTGILPDWHPGHGQPAWIFADQILINSQDEDQKNCIIC
jgi:hexosaminidase